MDQSQVEQILRNPKFQKMVKKSALSWTLTIIMLVLYVGFCCCWLQQRIFNEFI